MDMSKITAKMPDFVKEHIGQAQKHLTILEGEARKVFDQTWTRIHDWQTKTQKTGDEWHAKAFHTVGIATRKDFQAVNRQIKRLRTDLRKLSKSASSKDSKPRSRKHA
ncbi:MAG: hypothetical protein JXR96_09790 [Deltaproteobacteria bacterium]|nr:hypothetical protein [Deltaproteobacteria bacterium]